MTESQRMSTAIYIYVSFEMLDIQALVHEVFGDIYMYVPIYPIPYEVITLNVVI